MKFIIKSTCLLVVMTVSAFGEPTPAGTTPTYSNSNGGFTYYYINGEPVPPGIRIFISGVGTSQLINEAGQTTGTIYATPSEATTAREAAGNPDCSGVVVVGPGGMPEVCNRGTSASGSSATAVDEAAYDKASFELTTLLYGATEIGSKSCTPAGTKMPGSLSTWWSAVKTYSTGEVARDKTLNETISKLQKKIQTLTSGSTSSKDMQIEAIQVQIDLVTASIESMNGNNGRIPLREKLLVASLASTEANGKENIKTVETYKKMVDVAFVASVKAATAACDRKKKVKTCVTDEDGVEECTEKEVKDPVPGCDVALAQIPVMRAGPAQSYGEVYLSPMTSTAMNDRMEMFENEMKNSMAAIPRSNDANYDWSSPMEDGLKAMIPARKDSGTKCPSADEAGGKDKITKASENFLSSIGLDETSTSVTKAFGDVWGAADKVIGQAAHRGEYFTLVGKKVNAVLVMDRAKLQTLLSTKTKLEDYLKNIKTALSSNAVAAAKPAASSSSAPTSLAKSAQATVVGKSAQTDTGINKSGSLTSSLAAAAAYSSPVSLISSPSSNTLKPLGAVSAASSTSGGSINTASGLSLGSAQMAIARKSLEAIAKNDKKIAGMSSTSDASNSGSGIAATSAKAVLKSSTPKSALISGNSASNITAAGSDSAAAQFTGTIATSFKALDNDPKANEYYKSASNGRSEYSSNGSSYSGNGRYGSRSTTETTVGYSSPGAGAKASSSINLPSSTSKRSAAKGSDKKSDGSIEDGKILSASIAAKKSKKKDEYAALENDSLFQRVTKAYIRNYEKVEGDDVPAENP